MVIRLNDLLEKESITRNDCKFLQPRLKGIIKNIVDSCSIEQKSCTIYLDFSDISTINVASVGTLVSISNYANDYSKEKGIRIELKLAIMEERIKKVFTLLKLHEYLPFTDTIPEGEEVART